MQDSVFILQCSAIACFFFFFFFLLVIHARIYLDKVNIPSG